MRVSTCNTTQCRDTFVPSHVHLQSHVPYSSRAISSHMSLLTRCFTYHSIYPQFISIPQIDNTRSLHHCRFTAAAAASSSFSDSNNGPGGPESIDEDLLRDFLYGMGSSVEPPERPKDAPGTS